MSDQREVHFCGSIGLDDAETVFRTISETVGYRAKRYPDGETGLRSQWIIWQEPLFSDHPHCEVGEEIPLTLGGANWIRRFYMCSDDFDPAKLEFPDLGYAAEAISSYGQFKRLRDEGTIPAGTRFQVSLPTPTAVIVHFVIEAEQAAFEPAYERAMQAEIAEIVSAIPHEDLAIQFDVCHEILAYDEGPEPVFYDDILGGTVERLENLAKSVPDGVQFGIHLCYGDPGHEHIKEPTDAGTAVLFANAICEGVTRMVNWIHLPVPRERKDDDYFAPLMSLELSSKAALYLGLVHLTDGLGGVRDRIAIAERYVSNFGIATECGFGRRAPETIQDLLKLHADAAR